MLKPASLRAALTAAVPHLQKNPQDLHVFIEAGSLRSTMSGGLSCEYSYTLSATVTDYADHADSLFIPILAWLRTHQPDMLLNPERMREGFAFEVDFLGHSKCDIAVKLKLTERVRVTQQQVDREAPAGLSGPATVATITHLPEPPLEPLLYIEHWELFIKDEKIGEWDTRPFAGPVTPDPLP